MKKTEFGSFKAMEKIAQGLRSVKWRKRLKDTWKVISAGAVKYGYYAGLLLLLALLGFASNAYRNRDTSELPENTARPVEVSAVITPEPTQTAVPTVEESLKYIWPARGGVLTEFSDNALVWSETLSQWQTHLAVDISANAGESVVACADGVIKDTYNDPLWGNVIVIEHKDGMESLYANLNTLNLVSVGQNVACGETISAVGRSAAAESEMPWHLHFEMRNAEGEYFDFSEYAAQKAE